MFELDDLDKKILDMLQNDGRTTHVEIGRQLDVGHTRVRDRIHRMEAAGVITGYRATIDPLVLGYSIHCLIHVEVDQQKNFDLFAEKVITMDEVVEVANLTGQYDAIVRVWVRDVTHLRDFLYNKLSVLPEHQKTVSSIVLNQYDKPLGLH